jgi:hypothetical protein
MEFDINQASTIPCVSRYPFKHLKQLDSQYESIKAVCKNVKNEKTSKSKPDVCWKQKGYL